MQLVPALGGANWAWPGRHSFGDVQGLFVSALKYTVIAYNQGHSVPPR